MMKLDTNQPSAHATPRLIPGVGVVDLAKTGLPESLIGKVSEWAESR